MVPEAGPLKRMDYVGGNMQWAATWALEPEAELDLNRVTTV